MSLKRTTSKKNLVRDLLLDIATGAIATLLLVLFIRFAPTF
jgi:hypothetical protein